MTLTNYSVFFLNELTFEATKEFTKNVTCLDLRFEGRTLDFCDVATLPLKQNNFYQCHSGSIEHLQKRRGETDKEHVHFQKEAHAIPFRYSIDAQTLGNAYLTPCDGGGPII